MDAAREITQLGEPEIELLLGRVKQHTGRGGV
jgi:hypothetical protein